MGSFTRWGVIAPGRIAHRFAQGFSDRSDGSITAVASRDKNRAHQFAEQFAIPKIYDNYQSLIEDDQIDAIYISSPHRFHFETAKQGLKAGKAVLCEKPLTVTAPQATQLATIAKQNNCFLMEALWSRFLPTWQNVKQWVDCGEIGNIQLLYSTFGFNVEKNEQDRLFNLELAGGSLLDTGIYCLSMSQFILNREPQSVHSAVQVGTTGVDERCSVLLDYGDITSQFTCTFLTPLDNQFIIIGEKGKITVDANFWDATRATLAYQDGSEKVINIPHRASGFEYQVDEVHACLAQDQTESTIMSTQQTIATMQIMDQILENAGVYYPFAPRNFKPNEQ